MEQIEARILDRIYKLQVPGEERARLLHAVALVDRKMREIRDAGKAQGPDRIAVNAALQLVYEFLGREAAAQAATTAGTKPVAAPSDHPPSDIVPVEAGSGLDVPDAPDAPAIAASAAPISAGAAVSAGAVPASAGAAVPAGAVAGMRSDGPSTARRSGTADARRATGHKPSRAESEKRGAGPNRTADRGPGGAERSGDKAGTPTSAAEADTESSRGAGGSQPDIESPGLVVPDADIDRLSSELEAEIRRQESLF